MVVGPAGIDGLSNTTLALAAAGQEPEMLSDSAGAYWAARRSLDGSCGESKTVARAPMPDSANTKTLYSMRAMQVYAFPSRRAEIDERVEKARSSYDIDWPGMGGSRYGDIAAGRFRR